MEHCFSVLCFLESITDVDKFYNVPELRSALYNNFACYFRRIEKLDISKNYLEKAFEIIKTHKL